MTAGPLAGRTVLITGASRGIGAAAARLCHARGAKVLLHASGPSAALDNMAGALGQDASDAILENLEDAGAGARLVARAVAQTGKLAAIVNNAGVYLPSPLVGDEKGWRKGWDRTLAVNLQAVADICRAGVAHFREHGGGTFVNIASRAGHRGDGPDHAAYAASKGAVLAMTKTYARALAGENILFYAIAPGWVETRMAPEDIAARKRAVDDIPLGRVAAPEEAAEMIAFLLTGACASATGATFDINGASYVR